MRRRRYTLLSLATVAIFSAVFLLTAGNVGRDSAKVASAEWVTQVGAGFVAPACGSSTAGPTCSTKDYNGNESGINRPAVLLTWNDESGQCTNATVTVRDPNGIVTWFGNNLPCSGSFWGYQGVPGATYTYVINDDREHTIDSGSFTMPSSCTPVPTATLSASPTSVTSGNRSTLTWDSTNATSCTAPSGNWSNAGSGTGFGNAGGNGSASTYGTGAGGGGAGAAGGTINGGDGKSYSISGIARYYSGGGSGRSGDAPYTFGTGGQGGGGGYEAAGTPNTGGGGGMGGGGGGGNGGSGIVIIYYASGSCGTGGTVVSSGGFCTHTFTTSGTFTPPSGVSSVESLGVAGGGGGGADNVNGTRAGGGGGGGLVYNAAKSVVVATPYAVTVGGGGAGATSGGRGNNGNNSTFDNIAAFGGGGGCGVSSVAGASGGSGGGGAGAGNAGGAATQVNSGESLSGEGLTDPLTANTTFTFQCTGPGGTSPLASATVNITGALVNGSCAATHYNCTTGTSVNNVSGATSWTWTCNGANRGTNASWSEAKPPAATISADPDTIDGGQSSLLKWNSMNATSCTEVGGFSTGGAVSNNTGVAVSPTVTSYYQIYCDGAGGFASEHE